MAHVGITESCELCIDKPLFPIGPFFLVPAYGSVGGSIGKDSEMWQCDFVEETYHWGWALRFQRPIPGPVSLCLLPTDQDVQLSVTAPPP